MRNIQELYAERESRNNQKKTSPPFALSLPGACFHKPVIDS